MADVGVCFFRLSDTLQVEGLKIAGSLKKQIEDEVKGIQIFYMFFVHVMIKFKVILHCIINFKKDYSLVF